jgi:outer membrane receptor protein involved in Fe transport
VSVFLDGVRVNEPAVEEVNFDLLPLDDVERIEIIRGPHAIFGRNTLGGAVHIVTRRAGRRPEAEAEVEGGSAGYQTARARAGGPLGPLDGYLSLEQSTVQGWREASQAQTMRGFGKLGLRRGDTDVVLSYQLQQDDLHQPGSLPLSMLEVDRTKNYTPGDFFRPTLHLVTANARQRLAPGLSLSANAFLRVLDAEQFNSSWISSDTRLFNATRTTGATLQLDHHAPLGPFRSDLSLGGEASYTTIRIQVHQEPNSQVSLSTDGLPLPRLSSDVSDTQHAAGAWLQERLRIASGPLSGLSVIGALRFDWIAHDILDTSPDDPGKATGTRSFSAWVPAAGLSWALPHGIVASASYTGGFRAPAFLELTCADPAAPCIGLQAGVAPDTSLGPLRPVHSRTVEAGVSVSPWEALTARASVFRIDLHDDIFSVTPAGTTSVVFQNVGDTRRQGVELALRGRAGPVTADAAYAYTVATFQSDLELATPRTGGTEQVPRGAELPLTPRHRASLDARVRVFSWLDLGAGVRYVGSQWFQGDEANVAPKLPAYTVFSAGAEARWRTLSAFVRATNLLDRRYSTFGTYSVNGQAPGQPIEPFLTPAPPLQLFAGLRWELR